MKPFLMLILFALQASSAACAAPAVGARGGRSPSEATAVAWLEAYEAAHNAFDVDAAMALFADDAEFELVGQGTLRGLTAIRALHEYDRGIRAQVTFRDCRPGGATVTCVADEANDWLAAAGLEALVYPSSVFTFDDRGRIRRIAATLSPEGAAAMGAVLADFVPWLMAERPAEAGVLFSPEGQFIYSEANGRLVVALLGEWRGAK